MDGLKPGRIVYYVLGATDVAEITRRRTTAHSIAERMKIQISQVECVTPLLAWPAGAQAHMGNEVKEGDIYPAMIVRVWGQDSGCSNLRVILDGTDEYWSTSRNFNADGSPASWHWMFDGQATRYDATKPH